MSRHVYTPPLLVRYEVAPHCPCCGRQMEPEELDDGTPSAFVFWCEDCGERTPEPIRVAARCGRCGDDHPNTIALFPLPDGSGWEVECIGECSTNYTLTPAGLAYDLGTDGGTEVTP